LQQVQQEVRPYGDWASKNNCGGSLPRAALRGCARKGTKFALKSKERDEISNTENVSKSLAKTIGKLARRLHSNYYNKMAL